MLISHFVQYVCHILDYFEECGIGVKWASTNSHAWSVIPWVINFCLYFRWPMHNLTWQRKNVIQYTLTDTGRKWYLSTRTACTGHETMVYESYRSYGSYGSWNNGLRVVQILNFISLVRRHVPTSQLVRVVKQWFTSHTNRTGHETMDYESYR